MSRVRIYPYKSGSQSAKALSQDTGWLRLKHNNSRFRVRPSDKIINWGSTTLPVQYANATVINAPSSVALAADKIQTFMMLDGSDDSINVPPWSTDKQDAEQWIADGKKVVCRTLTRANSGRGIVIAETLDELVNAPLYTQYVPKTHEYRYHVFDGEVIDVQRKMRNREVADEDVNWQVRNHSNGFVFGREGVSVDANASACAIAAIAELGLDFGAVDLIYNERRNQYYLLEINTAPGLTGTTLEKYKEAFYGRFS